MSISSVSNNKPASGVGYVPTYAREEEPKKTSIDGIVSLLSIETNNHRLEVQRENTNSIAALMGTGGGSMSDALNALQKDYDVAKGNRDTSKMLEISQLVNDLALQFEGRLMTIDLVAKARLRPANPLEDPERRDNSRAKTDFEQLIERTPTEVILEWLKEAKIEDLVPVADNQTIKA